MDIISRSTTTAYGHSGLSWSPLQSLIQQLSLVYCFAVVWPVAFLSCISAVLSSALSRFVAVACGLAFGKTQKHPTVAILPSGSDKKPKLQISWPGYGLFFWWQLGVLQYLQEHFDLSQVPVLGSSAGSFISIFSRCGVDPQAAFDSAYKLAQEHHIFTRPLGLAGIWKPIIKEWMFGLLPANAAAFCSKGGATLMLVDLPHCNLRRVSEFESTEDLVEAATSSAHIPWFLDWQFCSNYKGVPCIDGGFRYVMLNAESDLLPVDGQAVLKLDPNCDPHVRENFSLIQCVRLLSPAGFQEMIKCGYAFGQKLHRGGTLELFDLTGLALKTGDGHLEEAERAEEAVTGEVAGQGQEQGSDGLEGAGKGEDQASSGQETQESFTPAKMLDTGNLE